MLFRSWKGSDWHDLRRYQGDAEIANQLQREFAIARRRELRAEIAADRQSELLEELEQEIQEERDLERETPEHEVAIGRLKELPERAPEMGLSR